MHPARFSDILKSGPALYYKGQYPDATSCAVLKKQIADIRMDLVTLEARKTEWKTIEEFNLIGKIHTTLKTLLAQKSANFAAASCATQSADPLSLTDRSLMFSETPEPAKGVSTTTIIIALAGVALAVFGAILLKTKK